MSRDVDDTEVFVGDTVECVRGCESGGYPGVPGLRYEVTSTAGGHLTFKGEVREPASSSRFRKIDPDNVNSPSHYRWLPVEVIEVTEHLNFCLGNVIKYVLRADHKGKPVEDLEKARWYLDREIQRRRANQ